MSPTARLFVAVWPSSAVRAALTAWDVGRDDTPTAWRAVPPPNWHVTLRFLGVAAVDVVVDRLSAARFPCVDLDYGPEVIAFERGQAVVPVAGAEPLAAAVRDATGEPGEPTRPEFRGHLTIGRSSDDGGVGVAPVGRGFSARQTVASVALVSSNLGTPHVTYRTVAVFPTARD